MKLIHSFTNTVNGKTYTSTVKTDDLREHQVQVFEDGALILGRKVQGIKAARTLAMEEVGLKPL
jgi:hypothetical protein